MRICSFEHQGVIQAGVGVKDRVIPAETLIPFIGDNFPDSLQAIICGNRFGEFRRVLHNLILDDLEGLPLSQVKLTTPYRHPSKIWGIGLNYADHAQDLDAVKPDREPASFMKPDTAIVSPGEPIQLPDQSRCVTGEAEIGVIIGRDCRDVPLAQVQDVILGYTPIIDMTAVDILQRNPRFLTRAKSFDTFFSFGPWIVTADEIPDVNALTITTIHNGQVHRSNRVGNMTFPPRELVAFHSRGMTLRAGDIISCGTPGAAELKSGDRIEAQVSGIGRLRHPVA